MYLQTTSHLQMIFGRKTMSILQLKAKRNQIMEIVSDIIYLMVTEKDHLEDNKYREQELKNLKRRIKRIDAKLAKEN